MINRFKLELDQSVQCSKACEQRIRSISEELRKAMGLSKKDVNNAADEEMVWQLGQYKIEAKQVVGNDWPKLLFITVVGYEEIGYLIKESKSLPTELSKLS